MNVTANYIGVTMATHLNAIRNDTIQSEILKTDSMMNDIFRAQHRMIITLHIHQHVGRIIYDFLASRQKRNTSFIIQVFTVENFNE